MKTAKGTEVHPALAKALKAHPAILAAYEAMAPSCQREHNKYVAEAKQPETQARRAEKVLENIQSKPGKKDAKK